MCETDYSLKILCSPLVSLPSSYVGLGGNVGDVHVIRV